MTAPLTPEALVEALARSMWEQSYATLQDASWDVALQVAKHIPDGQAASCLATVRSKAAEIVSQHFAPLLAAHQQVTAERDKAINKANEEEVSAAWDKAMRQIAENEAARLRTEVEAKDKRIAELTETWKDKEGKPWFPASARTYAAVVASLIRTSNRFRILNAEKRRLQAEVEAKDRALKPFADEADRYDPPESDDDQPLWDVRGSALCLRDLRAARAATAREG